MEAIDDRGNPIETYTGINQGYAFNGAGYFDVPKLTNPKHITGIPSVVKADDIKIGTAGGNFTILCNSNACIPESYAIVNLIGQTVQSGALSGAAEERIVVPGLRPGVYLFVVNKKGGGKFTEKVVVDNR